ncbi:MAG: discoidin domain-containing protein [Nanoarchaeota archaeon]|nr:discoidin domain-containing protein [Nanoarchaeota archaeon]
MRGVKVFFALFIGVTIIGLGIASVITLLPIGNINLGEEISFICNYSSDNASNVVRILSNFAGEWELYDSRYLTFLSSETTGGNYSVNLLGTPYNESRVTLTSSDSPICSYSPSAQDVCSVLMATTWLGTNSQWWLTTSSNESQWVIYDLNNYYEINKLKLSQNGVYYAEHVSIEASNDSNQWVSLYENYSATSLIEFEITPIKARYVRLNVSDSSTGTSIFVNYLNITGLNYTQVSDGNITVPLTIPENIWESDETDYSWACEVEDINGNNFTGENQTVQLILTNKDYPQVFTTDLGGENYSSSDNLLINCLANTTDRGIRNMSLFTNYTSSGNFEKVGSYYGNSLEDTIEDIINLTIVPPSDNPVNVYSDKNNGDGYQKVNSVLVNYNWDGVNTVFWNANYLNYSIPQWLIYDLGDVYNISSFDSVAHASLFPSSIKIQFSEDNLTWKTVYENDSAVTSTVSSNITPTNTRYINLTLNRASSLYYNNFQVQGAKSIINQNETSHNFSVPLNLIKEGDFSYYCSADNTLNVENNSGNNYFHVNYLPTYQDCYLRPQGVIDPGEDVFVYCNYSDVNRSNLDVYLEENESGSWGNGVQGVYKGNYIIEGIGDSIMSSGGILTRLDTLLGSNSSSYNFGIGGNTCDQVYSRFDANITNGTTVIVLCGINDLVSGGTNHSEVREDMEAIQELADEKGNNLIWMSVGTASQQSDNVRTNATTLNTWMEENFTVEHATLFVDWHHEIWNGTEGYCEPDYCNVDGLHPNSAGYDIIANKTWKEAFNYSKFDYWGFEVSTSSFDSDGIYYVRVHAEDGEDDSEYTLLNLSFDAVESSTTTEETEETSNGGSSSFIYLNDNQFDKGKSQKLFNKYTLKFKINKTYHSLKLENISENEVKFTLASDPIEFSMKENETKTFKLDDEEGVEITLNKINSNFVDIFVKKVKVFPIPDETNISENQEGNLFNEEGIIEKSNLFWNYRNILALVLLVLVLILFWEDLSKNHSRKRKK